jgi:hypothetical protein
MPKAPRHDVDRDTAAKQLRPVAATQIVEPQISMAVSLNPSSQAPPSHM